eukprot:jgi/Bigna1/80443/fgenesh1_pg.71_\
MPSTQLHAVSSAFFHWVLGIFLSDLSAMKQHVNDKCSWIHDQADALCSSWGHNVRSVLHRVTGCDQSACGLDLSVNLDQSHPKLVDVDLNRRVRAHLSTNGNLCRSFCSFVKPDTPICRSRAWARSHIGRPASRLFECHLDDWHDNSGVLLKLQLRAGTCETEEHRAEICNLPPSFSVCPLCNAEVVQSVNHLIHHCTHLNAERCKLLSHVRSALSSASSLHSSFFDAPDSSKTKILLGAPSDDPIVDRLVDMAFRKFLLRMEVLRRVVHRIVRLGFVARWVWCSCLVISKHEQTITAGFRDAWS